VYESFFGLTGKPFQLNPDPAFFYGSRGHKRAFAYLQYGVHQSEGFIIITGEVGAGKTTLVRSLLEQIDPNQLVAAQLVTTQLDAEDLLRSVGMAFGLPIKALDKAQLLAELEAFLTSLVPQGKRALLVVDEAQNLPPRAIEELRMLSNFQLGNQGLLQSFLVGQPELRLLMQGPELQQLRQRVIASYHLGPMDRGETQAYVEHRLHHVGWNSDPRFEPGAFDAIYTFSGGIPRRINTLCNRLLLAAALSEEHVVSAASVDSTADEIRLELTAGNASAAAASEPRQESPSLVSNEPGIGLEERVVRLERAMTATLDLLQQLRRARAGTPAGARPPDQAKS
jgi:general secretion pathway protein A